MLRHVHAAAGTAGLILICGFWGSTLAVEIAGDAAAVVAVKTAIAWGLAVLIPALIVAGATGDVLVRRRPGARVKARRMRVAAANGLLVLVPAALYLAWAAGRGAFGPVFWAVQAAELTAGAVNVVLLTANLRDGLRMRRARAASPSGAAT